MMADEMVAWELIASLEPLGGSSSTYRAFKGKLVARVPVALLQLPEVCYLIFIRAVVFILFLSFMAG